VGVAPYRERNLRAADGLSLPVHGVLGRGTVTVEQDVERCDGRIYRAVKRLGSVSG
jgi:hypothetical protein